MQFGSIEDDAFWTSEVQNNRGNRQNNKTNSNDEVNYNQPTSTEIRRPLSNFTPIEPYNEQNAIREENAYNEWNRRRNFETQGAENSNVQTSTVDEQAQQRESRRFGSERTYYHNDPYFNALSNQWSWTTFYTPIVRPGFYNWAPGWNIGLGWNSFNGWNIGLGYNAFFPGWGLNSWMFYDPWFGWYNPWNPWRPFGFYDPFWGPGWGFNYWNWYYFYHPFYRPFYRFTNGQNNDMVLNRPMFVPRAAGQNSSGGSTLPPRGRVGNEINNPAQPVNPNPSTQRSRPDVQQQEYNTTRPGGDIVRDRQGNPTYVPPRSRPDNIREFNNQPAAPNNPEQHRLRGNDRIQPSTPEFRNYSPPVRERSNHIERSQPQPPPVQHEMPSQPRMNPRGFDGSGGMSSPGLSPGMRGGGAPQSRPR